MNLASFFFDHEGLFVIPIEHLGPEGMSSELRGALAGRGRPGDWLDLFDASFSLYWKRASELNPPEGMKRMQLFNKISPHDLAQGRLGDCWLIASIAALAEHPSLVRRLFVNHEINDRGKYQVRLYNHHKAKFEIITIDDYLPVDWSGTPVFAKPRGGEIWVCLLEKAIAKAVGCWENIDGGFTSWALEVLTGGLCVPADEIMLGEDGDLPDHDALFERINAQLMRGDVLGVSTGSDDNLRAGLEALGMGTETVGEGTADEMCLAGFYATSL